MVRRICKGNKAGLTTVELLIVLGIIGIILTVSVPTLLRMGLFGGQRAELAGRELYTMLRAARVYATTYNVNAAVVYTADIASDSFTGEQVPIADGYSLVRQLKRTDLEQADFAALNSIIANSIIGEDDVYIPIGATEGSFKRFENGTAVLPELFEVANQFGNFVSTTGLSDVVIWDTWNQDFYAPRPHPNGPPYSLDYSVNGDELPNSFPAHVFLTNGALRSESPRQRILIRTGLRPDAEVSDRFVNDLIFSATPAPDLRNIVVNRNNPNGAPQTVTEYLGPTGDELEVDLEIELYAATGRVKMQGDT